MHVHASILDFLIFVAYLIIAEFLLRYAAFKWPDSAIGSALGVLV